MAKGKFRGDHELNFKIWVSMNGSKCYNGSKIGVLKSWPLFSRLDCKEYSYNPVDVPVTWYEKFKYLLG